MTTTTSAAPGEGLGSVPPGARLAAALEAVDLATTPPEELPVVLRALWRQHNHDEARLLDAVRECGLGDRSAPGGRQEALDEFSADEARAALALSRTGAWKLLGLADDLAVRLPAVRRAMHDGEIDEARARAFRDGTEPLSDEHTDRVVALLLPEAPRTTAWALRQRIEQIAMALDPEWAAKRYDEACRQRRVRARRTEAGTATLSGLDLPLDETAQVAARIEALAAAAKAAGHPGLLDTIRADLYLALLGGRFAGLGEDEVVRAVVEEATRPTTEDEGAGADASDDGDVLDPDPGPGPAAPTGTGRRRPRRARIEVRVGLTTLLGLDERPAEMPAWGPIPAPLARELAAAHVRGEWRVAVTRPDGTLGAALLARRRPAGWRGAPSAAVIELWVDAETLAGLDPAEHPAWARVLVDLQARLTAWGPPPTDDPGRRFAREDLGRWVRMRDRSCVFPHCAVPALAADLDHTRAAGAGGDTVDVNLDPVCLHDHLAKHQGGWGLRQTAPGHFVWTSRCGATHLVPLRPVVHHLPDPDPPPPSYRSRWRPVEFAAERGGVWANDPHPVGAPRDGPPLPANRAGPDDDPPPF